MHGPSRRSILQFSLKGLVPPHVICLVCNAVLVQTSCLQTRMKALVLANPRLICTLARGLPKGVSARSQTTRSSVMLHHRVAVEGGHIRLRPSCSFQHQRTCPSLKLLTTHSLASEHHLAEWMRLNSREGAAAPSSSCCVSQLTPQSSV